MSLYGCTITFQQSTALQRPINEANFVFDTSPKELSTLAASEHAAKIICIDDDSGVQSTIQTSIGAKKLWLTLHSILLIRGS